MASCRSCLQAPCGQPLGHRFPGEGDLLQDPAACRAVGPTEKPLAPSLCERLVCRSPCPLVAGRRRPESCWKTAGLRASMRTQCALCRLGAAWQGPALSSLGQSGHAPACPVPGCLVCGRSCVVLARDTSGSLGQRQLRGWLPRGRAVRQTLAAGRTPWGGGPPQCLDRAAGAFGESRVPAGALTPRSRFSCRAPAL